MTELPKIVPVSGQRADLNELERSRAGSFRPGDLNGAMPRLLLALQNAATENTSRRCMLRSAMAAPKRCSTTWGR
jgi:hypothetical protein